MRRVAFFVLAMALSANLPAQAAGAQEAAQSVRKVVERTAPIYPAIAKRTHVGGEVRVQVVIRANGTVKSVRALGGSPVLIDPALAAVRQWRFEAAAQESVAVVEVIFRPE
jgi:TonB family protein